MSSPVPRSRSRTSPDAVGQGPHLQAAAVKLLETFTCRFGEAPDELRHRRAVLPPLRWKGLVGFRSLDAP